MFMVCRYTAKRRKSVRMTGWKWRMLACVLSAVLTVVAAEPVRAAQGPSRVYELVSPSSKGGNDVIANGSRVRAAASGEAFAFASLGAFADAHGTGVATEYMAVRHETGWATHGITPVQEPLPIWASVFPYEGGWQGDFSADLNAGVFRAFSAVPTASDPHPAVEDVPNLYLRRNLRDQGAGTYELLTDCPACAAPLPPVSLFTSRPGFAQGNAGTSTVTPFQHVVFESASRLTADAVRGSLYEYDGGDLRLVTRVPATASVCDDDVRGSECTPVGGGVAGQGVAAHYALQTISADGSRIVFTIPTQTCDAHPCGRMYMRINHTQSVKINASEKRAPDAEAPAVYWNATADGQRVFFTTDEQLIDDDGDTSADLYMYDFGQPLGGRLTLISVDDKPSDDGRVVGTFGVSEDGRSAYFAAAGQLVADAPVLDGNVGIYLWHDGDLRFIGHLGVLDALAATNFNPIWSLNTLGSRVTPDGTRLAFLATDGLGLTGYDHGGWAEFYVYDANTGKLACASCEPSGARAIGNARLTMRTNDGAATTTNHIPHPLSDDGRSLFFSSPEALDPADVNGRMDAYEYDVESGRAHLLSSGRSSAPSYFMDASASGDDAFILTQERLTGWDRDENYDVYDARVGGGFPEPVPAAECAGDSCQPGRGSVVRQTQAGTERFAGAGDGPGKLARPRGARRCRRGFHRKRVRGHSRCVRLRRHARHVRRAGSHR